MPKSGFAANSQGKVVALAVVNAINGRPMVAPTYVNTCYSLIAPDYGISVADVYRVDAAGHRDAPGGGGVSPAQRRRGVPQRRGALRRGLVPLDERRHLGRLTVRRFPRQGIVARLAVGKRAHHNPRPQRRVE